jgi:hypothetical protein
MAQKRPFLEDGSQYGVSRSQFRRMRKAEKREAMLQWFSENYEDPAENTPYESAEGGYQYIWGGPYEARDELYAQFGDIVPEQLIDEVAQEIERHGLFDWAPVQKGPNDRGFSDEDDEPAPLDIYLDEPSPQYGTPAEQDARKKALFALERLEKIITKRQAIGIGHNHPPETVDGPDLPEIQKAVAELKLEFHQLNPTIAKIKQWAKPLRDALVVAGKWAAQKADKAVDAATVAIGTGGGTYVLTQLFPPIHDAFDSVINWLEIAAKSLF